MCLQQVKFKIIRQILNQEGKLPLVNMINNKTIIKRILYLISLIIMSDCLLSRNIALNYLYLDKNRDNLVSLSQLDFKSHNQEQRVQVKQKYYNWRKYQLSIYPSRLFEKFDEDKDQRISLTQLDKIIKYKIKKYAGAWSFNKFNFLKDLQTQDYLSICDMDKDNQLSQVEFVNCLRGFIIYQYESYPYKIKSLLYPNKTIGYDFQQFQRLLPQFPKGQSSAQNQIKQLFDSFQWPQSKIPKDDDLLIGHEQGRFMEPTILYFYLDKNWDEKLDKKQTAKFFAKYGGQQAFEIADVTDDGQLDQAQIISYYMFASCIQDCSQYLYINNCRRQVNQQNLKYQTSKQICNMFEKLLLQLQKRQQISVEQNNYEVKLEQKQKIKEEL